MSNDYVRFKPADEKLPSEIRFIVTKKAFTHISENYDKAVQILADFTQLGRVIMTLRPDAGAYDMLTAYGTFVCKISDDKQGMVMMDYHPNTLTGQSYALKYGVFFDMKKGIIVQIKLSNPIEKYFDIENGTRHDDNSCFDRDVSLALDFIQEKMIENVEKTKEEDESYQPPSELSDLLQLSEQYSILSSELEGKKCREQGKLAYQYIETAEYDRIDRVAYEFGFNKIDEALFKQGVMVDVEDIDGRTHTAEIIELLRTDEEEAATGMLLLFSEMIDLNDFYTTGWINLSYSTVNKDVQLAANEKIRTGEAKAKYMDKVLGENETLGFANKDLAALEKENAKREYPMNKSQVEAIRKGINTKDVLLVMGPPGTGKTTVILEWVKYFVQKEHKRVLISSQNNKAVDNVLARIAEEKDIDIIRVGSESKMQSEVIPFIFENKIHTLRHRIVEASQENYNHLDEIMKAWQQYLDRSKEIEVIEQKIQKAKKQLAEELQKEVVPLYWDVKEAKDNCLYIKRQRKSCTARIEKYYEQVQEWKRKGPLTLSLHKDEVRQCKEKIAIELKRYENLESDERSVVGQYQTCRRKYREAYELARDVEYSKIYMLKQELRQALVKYNPKPARSRYNIWKLFDEARKISLESVEDYDRIKKLIRKDWSLAEKIQGSMENWMKQMNSQQNYSLNEIVMESANLVGATCIGINSQRRFANLDFDVTIIDEAGQIQIHNALVPMSVSNKLIMLGDHKQIPPSADQDMLLLCDENGVDRELMEKSLFEKMYEELPEENKIMLDTQYRMPAEIADTISDWFYDGKYYSPEFKKGIKSRIPELFTKPFVIIDTSKEPDRFETKIENQGCRNDLEADILAELVRFMANNPENELKEIGVISAYKQQVEAIKKRMKGFLPSEDVNEMVASLDSFQGQERDVIFYSFTKSSNIAPYKKRIGFLAELRRLNVAMTRCKKMLVMVGDMTFLGSCRHEEKDEYEEAVYDKSEKQFADFINKLLSDVKKGNGELLSCKEFRDRIKGAVKNGDR